MSMPRKSRPSAARHGDALRRFPWFILAVLTFAPSIAAALPDGVPLNSQDSDAETPTWREEINVSANRVEARGDEVGSSVTVITAEEIERRKATTVADLLRTVPGVAVARSGGPGQVTSVFMRGGSSSQTLVLIDGVRVNSATTGAFDFADLSTDLIESVEILRGPQSTLYGSEAMGGVVSIKTRRGAPNASGVGLELLLEGGEGGQERLQASWSGGGERFDYALSISDMQSEPVSAASEQNGNTEEDPWQNTTGVAHLGWNFGDDGRVDVSLRAIEGDVATDGFDFFAGGPVDDPNRRQFRDTQMGEVRLQKQLGPVDQIFSVGYQDTELRGDDPNDFFSNFTIDNSSVRLASQSNFNFWISLITVGFEYEEREGGSVGSFDEKVDITSAYIQDAYKLGERFHGTLGVRWDDHSEFGDETTWRATGSFDVSAGVRLHASAGTGFKAPTLNDLYFPGFSNPDLRPETNEAFDFGIELNAFDDRFLVDLTWFSIDSEDLIVFDFATFLPQNLAEAESEGLEATLEIRPSASWRLQASHTYNKTEDLGSQRPLARRPKNRTTLDLFLAPWDAFDAVISWRSVQDRIDSDGSVMDDYDAVDLVLNFTPQGSTLAGRFEPWIRVTNLFDEEYEEIPGFTTPGRLASAGLRLRF